MSLVKDFDNLLCITGLHTVPQAMKFKEDLAAFVEQAESDREDAAWLADLEAAGVDNWSGIDYAHELRSEREGGEE
ncbi:hypothetical protein [Pseudomonas phage Waldo5]|uniref:Uncharacterized protein n=1 Tax=Pseudomonas phage Waldo5 TaxID=2762290 RepID=A0A7G8LJN0_9CAUD|nr:hypothetical protein [Pseudomonas phage Waldo5]